MSNKHKKPRLSANVKQPKARETELKSDYGIVCWQFSLMDMVGPFSFDNLSLEDWQLILDNLKFWETMTWNEIAGRRNHAISTDNLSPEAKKRLIELELDDIDEVFSLHLDGKKRLIGIRDRNIFRVLWWDPEHKVCPAPKKHT